MFLKNNALFFINKIVDEKQVETRHYRHSAPLSLCFAIGLSLLVAGCNSDDNSGMQSAVSDATSPQAMPKQKEKPGIVAFVQPAPTPVTPLLDLSLNAFSVDNSHNIYASYYDAKNDKSSVKIISGSVQKAEINGAFSVKVDSSGKKLLYLSKNGTDGTNLILRDTISGSEKNLTALFRKGLSTEIADFYITKNGSYVVFSASNTSYSDNEVFQVFLYDVKLGALTPISYSSDFGNDHSYGAKVSEDGSKVAFVSVATNFSAKDTISNSDIYIWNSATKTLDLISKNSDGYTGFGDSYNPVFDEINSKVAFESDFFGYAENINSDRSKFVYFYDMKTAKIIELSSLGSDLNNCRQLSLSANDEVSFICNTGSQEYIYYLDAKYNINELYACKSGFFDSFGVGINKSIYFKGKCDTAFNGITNDNQVYLVSN